MSAAGTRVTRQELLRARRRLERVRKGADLLRRRREALARELLRMARPALDARAAVVEESRKAYPALHRALALEGPTGLRAMAWPARELWIEVRQSRVWGVAVPDITDRAAIRRELDARGVPPAAGPSVAGAAEGFENLVEALLDAAPRDMLIRRLSAALARASRQVSALEHRVAPALEERIRTVRGRLEEREREEHQRLKHFAGRPGREQG